MRLIATVLRHPGAPLMAAGLLLMSNGACVVSAAQQAVDATKPLCAGGKTIACRAKGATLLLWLANLTAQAQTVTLAGVDGRAVFANTLNESSLEAATSYPRKLQAKRKAVTGGKIALKVYGVAWVCVND